MESESACSARFSNSCDKKECWNGGKRASQLLIDFEATELFLNLVKEKWVVLKDSKTSKKQVWDDIAIGLDEEGFLVRGEDKGVTCKTKWENLRRDYRCYISKFSQTGSGASDTNKKPKHFDQIEEILGEKNHSYRPPFISDSLNKKQNPTIFKDTANSKECKRDDECLEKDLELPKTATVNENKTSQEEGDISKAEKEKCKKSRKNNSESDIDDDDIYVDELDEEEVSSNLKKKRPSKATKSDQVLMAFKEMREERKLRHLEEKKEIQQRHTERMEKTQQLIDVLKSITSGGSSTRARSTSRSPRRRKEKRSLSGSSHGMSKVGGNSPSPRDSYSNCSNKSGNYSRKSRSPARRRSSSPPSSRSNS